MSQAEADKARAWAKVREWVDAPRRADADREAEKAKLGAALPPVRMPRAQQCAAGRAPAQPDEKAKGTPTELDKRGYGDYRLQAYTPTGTPSLRGLVSVMAGLTVEETDRDGLRLRQFREYPTQSISKAVSSRAAAPQERDEASRATVWRLFPFRSPTSPPRRHSPCGDWPR